MYIYFHLKNSIFHVVFEAFLCYGTMLEKALAVNLTYRKKIIVVIVSEKHGRETIQKVRPCYMIWIKASGKDSHNVLRPNVWVQKRSKWMNRKGTEVKRFKDTIWKLLGAIKKNRRQCCEYD